jgi:calcineurin-like phosphoesterase family protein
MKIVLNKGQNIFFTSDTHYSHANICSATTEWNLKDSKVREFKSIERMNSTLVDNINAVVGIDDILIHLGDWSFGGFDKIEEFRKRIMCQTIHLTYGNHDHHIRRNKDDVQDLFSSTQDYLFLEIRRPSSLEDGKMEKYSFVCMHYPIASWDGLRDGVPHLHGHVHLPPNLRTGAGKHLDVGVDGNDLKPISLNEVLNIMKGKQIKGLILPNDHHESKK